MRSLIAAELLKLRTTRVLYVAGLVVLAYAVLGPVLVWINPAGASVPEVVPSMLAAAFREPARFAGGAMLLVGLLSATAEFGHGTVLTTRLAEPHPTRVLAAKLAAMGLVAAAYAVALGLVSGGAMASLLVAKGVAVEPLSHGAPRAAGLLVVLTALHGVLGVAIGSLVRNTAAAVGAVLVWVFVVEGALPVVLNAPALARWLPGNAVVDVLAETAPAGHLVPVAAAGLLLAYAAAVVGASVVADRVREL